MPRAKRSLAFAASIFSALFACGPERPAEFARSEAAVATPCASYTVDLATAAFAISGGAAYPNQGAVNAFDNTAGTYASMITAPGTTYIGQNFGAPVELRRVRATGTASYSFRARVEYSDDLSTWTDTGVQLLIGPNTNSSQIFDLDTFGAHRYWRFLDLGGSNYLQIDELDLYACAAACTETADLSSTAGTISGGQAYPNQGPTNAFDGSTTNHMSLYTSATTWVGQDFGATPRALTRVRLFGTASFGFNARLQYSDDASSWSNTSLVIDIGPGDQTWREYSPGNYGAHRYWRFLDLGRYAYLQIQELDLRACESGPTCGNNVLESGEQCDGGGCCNDVCEFRAAGTVCRPAVVSCDTAEVCTGASGSCPADVPPNRGSDQSSAGAVISGGTVQAGFPPSNGFDDNTGTVVSIISSASTYLGRDFGATPRNIRRIRVHRNSIGSYPLHAKLQYSDNGTSWSDTNLSNINLILRSGWRSFDVEDYGAHRYWRLLDTGSGYFQLEELELLDRNICAAELHSASIILLAHDHQFQPQDFADMHAGGLTAKALKLTTDSIDWNISTRTRISNIPFGSGWANRWLDYRDQVQAIADDPANEVAIIRTTADIYQAKLNGRVGAILASEGSYPLEGQIARMQQFYDLGWRHTMLAWAAYSPTIDAGGHLTQHGRELIAEANRLGILLDTSHMGPALQAEVIAASSDPIVRSHASPLGFFGQNGGDSDDAMLGAIAASGGGRGVFALHFYDGYLGGSSATADSLVAGIEYAVQQIGIDHVALGGDYFPENGVRWVIPDVAHLEELTALLIDRGYSYEAVQKLLGFNLLRLYDYVWR